MVSPSGLRGKFDKMDEITKFVLPKNIEWVSSLSPKDVALILDSIALVHTGAPLVSADPSVSIGNDPYQGSDVPAIRGQEGENEFDAIVSNLMSNRYELENVAKSGKAGDFNVKWRSGWTDKHYKLLVDVKNYKTTVPTKEIEKLHRDIKVNNTSGGLLVSLNSKIVGVREMVKFYDLKTVRGNIPIIMIRSNNHVVIAEVIKLLFHIIEIRDMNCNKVDDYDGLISSINNMNDNVQTIIDCRETLQLSKAAIEKSLNDIMMQLMSCEYVLVQNINHVYKSLAKKRLTLLDAEPAPPSEKKIDVVASVVSSFKVSADIEVMLYQLYAHCDGEQIINFPDRSFLIERGDNSVLVKFGKTGKTASVVFSAVNKDALTHLKGYKKTATGYVVKFTKDNIKNIVDAFECI